MASRFGLLLFLATGVLPASAQQVTVEREGPLYSEARTDSSAVTSLQQGVTGSVAGKKGAWLNLTTDAAGGWLFSFNVRFASSQSAAPSASGGDGNVIGRLVGPRQQVNVTSTMGLRGLDAEDLKQAQLDPEPLKLLDQYAATRQDAPSKAQAGGCLRRVPVDAVPVQAGRPSPAPPGGKQQDSGSASDKTPQPAPKQDGGIMRGIFGR